MNMPKHMAKKANSRRGGIGSVTAAARAVGAGSFAPGVAEAAIEVNALSDS